MYYIMSTTYTIEVYDLPITLNKMNGTISVENQTRSTISTNQGKSDDKKYSINTISICEPLDKEQHTFDIIFHYKYNPMFTSLVNPRSSFLQDYPLNLIYIQVPVILENVSPEFINTECTEFIESVNSTVDSQSLLVNLSELFGTLTKDDTMNNPKTYSSTNSTIDAVIQYNAISLSNNPLGSLKPTGDSVQLNTKPAPRNYRKTGDYNPESRDPTRTMPIEVYYDNNKDIKNNANPDNIKDEIKTNLSTYTNLMISFIVVVFGIVTLYVIIILIPDSKLRITRLPKSTLHNGGGWSFRKMWNYLRR